MEEYNLLESQGFFFQKYSIFMRIKAKISAHLLGQYVKHDTQSKKHFATMKPKRKISQKDLDFSSSIKKIIAQLAYN